MNGRISFTLGSSCWMGYFSKSSCCQIVYHYQHGCGCRSCHRCLGGGSDYCGGGCSWGSIHWCSWHGVVSMGWAITLTSYLLLVGTLVLLFFCSDILGPGTFLVMGLLFWGGALVLGCSWIWGWGLGFGQSLPSNSRYIFIFQMREG